MEKLDEDWKGLKLWVLRTCSFSTPVLTLLTNIQLTPRASSGKHFASVAKIWLFGPHALPSNQNSFSTPVLTLLTGRHEQKSSGVEIGTCSTNSFGGRCLIMSFTSQVISQAPHWTSMKNKMNRCQPWRRPLFWNALFGCIAENCKQKNEVSGYETLSEEEIVIVILRQNRYCKTVNRNIIKKENWKSKSWEVDEVMRV